MLRADEASTAITVLVVVGRAPSTGVVTAVEAPVYGRGGGRPRIPGRRAGTEVEGPLYSAMSGRPGDSTLPGGLNPLVSVVFKIFPGRVLSATYLIMAGLVC